MHNPTPITHTPPATITHTTIALLGPQHTEIAVHHARTPDTRIALTVGAVLMTFYSCAAVQGLLAAFRAAQQHSIQLPAALPAAGLTHAPGTRITIAIEWTRAPNYAAVAQSATNKLKSQTLHWVDLHTAGVTWQLRDHDALNTTIEALANLHTVAVAAFLDGEQHSADPSLHDLTSAS